MSRYGGDCCHWDDGYDEGFADGQEKAGHSDAATLIAAFYVAAELLYDRTGRHDRADLVREVAADVERYPHFTKLLEQDAERRTKQAAALADARKAAA